MKSLVLRVAGAAGIFGILTALFVVPFASTQALSSKTYSFTPTHAKNYVTTGNVDFAGASATSNWYSPAWKYRQKITINKEFIGEELTDFPVVIRLDELTVDHLRSDRHDLVITAADGVTKLAHELEDQATVWVKVPRITPDEGAVLYLYSGNAAVNEDQASPEQVWTNNYAAVWHFNDDPAGTTIDSTAHRNDGTSNGGMNRSDSLVGGKIGNGLNFDGINDNINVPSNEGFGSSEATLSAWIKTNGVWGSDGGSAGTSTQGAATLIGRHSAATGSGKGFVLIANAPNINGGVVSFAAKPTDSTFAVSMSGTTNVSDGKWHSVVIHYSRLAGGENKLYIDGVLEKSAVNSSSWDFENQVVRFADGISSWYEEYSGIIDDVRWSSTSRSSVWLRAEYANQCDCEDFSNISESIEMSDVSSIGGASTVQLKSDRPLAFSSITSFIVNAGGEQPTFQLSNDAGKTWWFYTKNGWKGANPKNSAHSSSVADINGHIKTFPRGEGKLLWRAYLPSESTLDQITVTYSPASVVGGGSAVLAPVRSLSDPRIMAINTLFETAFKRQPTYDEWFYWANRVINGEKTTEVEVLGAMQYAALRSN